MYSVPSAHDGQLTGNFLTNLRSDYVAEQAIPTCKSNRGRPKGSKRKQNEAAELSEKRAKTPGSSDDNTVRWMDGTGTCPSPFTTILGQLTGIALEADQQALPITEALVQPQPQSKKTRKGAKAGARRSAQSRAKPKPKLPAEPDDSGSVDTIVRANCNEMPGQTVEDQASLSAGSQLAQLTLQCVPFDLLTSHCVTALKENPHLDLTCGYERSLRSVMDHLVCKWKRAMETFKTACGLTIIPGPDSGRGFGLFNSADAEQLQDIKVHQLIGNSGSGTVQLWYTFLPVAQEGGWLQPMLAGEHSHPLFFTQENSSDSECRTETMSPGAADVAHMHAAPTINGSPKSCMDTLAGARDVPATAQNHMELDGDEFMATLLSGVSEHGNHQRLAGQPETTNVIEISTPLTVHTAVQQDHTADSAQGNLQPLNSCGNDLLAEAFAEVDFNLLPDMQLEYDSKQQSAEEVGLHQTVQTVQPAPAARTSNSPTNMLQTVNPCLDITVQSTGTNRAADSCQHTSLPFNDGNQQSVLGDITNIQARPILPASPISGLLVSERGPQHINAENLVNMNTEFSGFPVGTKPANKTNSHLSWNDLFGSSLPGSPGKKGFDVLDLID